jgi:hypothetical protein
MNFFGETILEIVQKFLFFLVLNIKETPPISLMEEEMHVTKQ